MDIAKLFPRIRACALRDRAMQVVFGLAPLLLFAAEPADGDAERGAVGMRAQPTFGSEQARIWLGRGAAARRNATELQRELFAPLILQRGIDRGSGGIFHAQLDCALRVSGDDFAACAQWCEQAIPAIGQCIGVVGFAQR